MKRPNRRGAAWVVALLASHPAVAQEPEFPAPGQTPADPDSIGVTMLDEQLAGPGTEEEVEREQETPTVRRRGEEWSVRWRFRTSALLQEAAGYSDGTYAGGRARIYQRFTLKKGDTFRCAFLTEKDPGEASLADFLSGVVSLSNRPGTLRFLAGDFHLRSGQGLLFGSPRSFGKGAAVIEPALRSGWGIPEGMSSDEVNFFRGVAAGGGAGPVSVLLFASLRRVSPRISPEGVLEGFDESGYHRTGTELGRRDALLDRSAGGILRFHAGDSVDLGVGVLRSALMPAPGRDGDSPMFSGVMTTRRVSADLSARTDAFTIYGEVVGPVAPLPWIGGILYSPSEKLRAILLRRWYPPLGGSRRLFGFADASTGDNEAGTYAGVELSPLPGWIVSGYVDLFAGPAPGSGALFPRAGIDRLVSVRTSSPAHLGIEVRYRSRVVSVAGGTDPDAGLVTPGAALRREERYRAEVGWRAAGRLSCKFRLECSVSSPGGGEAAGRGIMGLADLSARPLAWMKLQSRIIFFGAGPGAPRLTATEADLPGTLSNTTLAGDGVYWYLLLSCRVDVHLSFSAKYSRFRRDDVKTIGSGASELPSNVRERAAFQFDFTW